jgi:hypothetical protein
VWEHECAGSSFLSTALSAVPRVRVKKGNKVSCNSSESGKGKQATKDAMRSKVRVAPVFALPCKFHSCFKKKVHQDVVCALGLTQLPWQGSIPDPLPFSSTSSSLPTRMRITTESPEKNQVSEGLEWLRELKKLGQPYVHALWIDKNGNHDWFQARADKILVTHSASKTAGALVSWLDGDGNVDKSSGQEFINVYDIKRRLKLPENEEHQHSGMALGAHLRTWCLDICGRVC